MPGKKSKTSSRPRGRPLRPLPTVASGVDRAVFLAGGQPKLGLLLGVTQQLISKWQRRGYVPLRRAIEIEHLLGVPRNQLLAPELVDSFTPAFE